jgi:hypothetical protein
LKRLRIEIQDMEALAVSTAQRLGGCNRPGSALELSSSAIVLIDFAEKKGGSVT